MTASSYLQERVADFKQHIDSKQLSRSYLTEFTVNLDESMQLLQGNLRRASELIASFKQVAVDQSSGPATTSASPTTCTRWWSPSATS